MPLASMRPMRRGRLPWRWTILGESACEVFKAYQAEGPLDDFPRVQLWVPTADPKASEIPRWMHEHIRRKEWRRCETKEELLARHAEWPEEED